MKYPTIRIREDAVLKLKEIHTETGVPIVKLCEKSVIAFIDLYKKDKTVIMKY